MKDLPEACTLKQLLGQVNSEGFRGLYDFFYMPSGLRAKPHRGYVFINFVNVDSAAQFQKMFHGRVLSYGVKPVAVISADSQGFEDNVERYIANIGKSTTRSIKPENVFFKPLPSHLQEALNVAMCCITATK